MSLTIGLQFSTGDLIGSSDMDGPLFDPSEDRRWNDPLRQDFILKRNKNGLDQFSNSGNIFIWFG